MSYKFNNIKSNFIIMLEYITIIFIILQCNSLFFPPIFTILLQVCIFILFLSGFFKIKRNYKYTSKLFVFLVIFSSIIILFLISNYFIYSYSLSYIYSLLLDPIMLIIYFYSFTLNNNIDASFLLRLENVIVLLSIISLIVWLLANLGMQPNTYISNTWTKEIDPGYFHILYSTQGKINFMGLQILRDTGIFVEAPMYSFILSIALLIDLFVRKSKLINYKNIILIITILTTDSTTGIIITILALSYYYFILNKHNNFSIVLVIIFIPIIILLLRIILVNKIGNELDLNNSFNLRVNDFIASFKTWKIHPIIGNGLNNSNAIVQNMIDWRLVPNGNIGLSTGFMTILAYGGLTLVLFYVIPTLLMINVSAKFRGLALFSFILFVFTIISTTSIYILLLSYFWAVIIYNKGNNS